MTVEELRTLSAFRRAIKNTKLVVIDFCASWSGPCKEIAPKFAEMAKEFDGAVLFFKVNVDDNEDTAGQCGIDSFPTFQFYEDGVQLDEVVGASEAKIREAIAKYK